MITDELIEATARGLCRHRVELNARFGPPLTEGFIQKAIDAGWEHFIDEGRAALSSVLPMLEMGDLRARTDGHQRGKIAGLKEAAEIVEGLRKRICDGGDLEENSILLKPVNAIHRRILALESTSNPLTNQHISTEDNKPK